jgi:hypothetical protein
MARASQGRKADKQNGERAVAGGKARGALGGRVLFAAGFPIELKALIGHADQQDGRYLSLLDGDGSIVVDAPAPAQRASPSAATAQTIEAVVVGRHASSARLVETEWAVS